MSVGSGIAIAGIWAAVAAIGYANPTAVLFVSWPALFATIAVTTNH
jgi:hypothetical protein